jgi:hypothetical protein
VTSPRSARDENAPVPYHSARVCFIRIKDGKPEFTTSIVEKREWCRSRARLLCAWPGEWKTDVFEVDKARAKKVLA